MKSSLVLGFALSLLVACTSTEFSEDRQGATVTRPGEKIVIVGADEEFPACVAESLRANDSAHNLMTEQEFRDALFPWFARSFDSRTLSKIIEKPTVKRRLAEIRTRYVVEVTGSTTSNLDNSGGAGFSGVGGGAGAYAGEKGAMFCGAGAGGAGCLGLMAWERKTVLSASVWDLTTGKRSGTVSAESTGTNVMPALVIPVPLIAPTETSACNALGHKLSRFLADTPAVPR